MNTTKTVAEIEDAFVWEKSSDSLVNIHNWLVRDAIKAGAKSKRYQTNPYSKSTQLDLHEAWEAGRKDSKEGGEG